MDNHEAIQHEFTRKCLRIYSEDLSKMAIEKLEQDLPEYAETINNGGGYNLDTRLATLTAERDALREACTSDIGIARKSTFAFDLEAIAEAMEDQYPTTANKIRAKAKAIRAALAGVTK